MSMEHPNTLYTDEELLQQAHIYSNEAIEGENFDSLINFCQELDSALNKGHITRDQHYDTLNNLFNDVLVFAKTTGNKNLESKLREVGVKYFPELDAQEKKVA